jgi:hypothetical protein
MNQKQELIEIIENFNYDNIKYKVTSQTKILRYQKIINICLHVINAFNIILSVLSETIQDKIIYAVIVCTIINSILNYELMKAHSTLQNNTKIINDFLRQNEIKNEIFIPTEMMVGNCKTPMNSVNELISV